MKHKAEQFDFPLISNWTLNNIKNDIISDEFFHIKDGSVFDYHADAYVNSINCVGVMGAGIALEFKKKYPKMFQDYRVQCSMKKIRPGDCYVYHDFEHDVYVLGMAVKNDWKYWSTLEWMELSIKSLKLSILEHDIKSINMPLIGSQNGRRGPHGKVSGMTLPPDKDEVMTLLEKELKPFSNKFKIDINVCISSNKPSKEQPTLDQFLETV